jgi:hypothetical protein
MLPELSLDTLTYAELVQLGLRRIPALSQKAWTDHNAHDPGITLLELYAYLLEQRIYWLDQISPPLEHALLRLLGTAPQRARPARTVITATQRRKEHVELERGVKLDAGPELSPLTFTLDESIAVVSYDRVRLSGTALERSVGPRPGRIIPLFPHHGGYAELAVDFSLRSPWHPEENPVALLFELFTPARVLPQWHPDSVDAPVPVQLEVRVSTPRGLEQVAFEDGTRGMRRSGILRVQVPTDWSPVNGAHRILISTPAATFTSPPRLIQLGVNAALASHRVRRVHTVREDWPRLPGRVLELKDTNGGVPLAEGLKVLVRREETQRWRRWHLVDDLRDQGPADRVFTLEGAVVRFGDGITGRLPVLPRKGNRLRVRYWAGGGLAGNLPAGTEFRPHIKRRMRLTSAVKAAGGREDESMEKARARAASSLRATTRAVTAMDHQTLAESTPGVAIRRAFAVVGFSEQHPLPAPGVITVYVLPDAPRGEQPENAEPVDIPAPVIDPGALEAVRSRLGQARLVTSEIQVLPARYRTVRLAFRAQARTPDVSTLRARIHEALRTYLDPLVGGSEGRGWPFEDALEPSALIQRAQEAAGEDAIIRECSVGLDGETPQPACEAVVLGCHRLPRLTEVIVRTEPLLDAGGLK